MPHASSPIRRQTPRRRSSARPASRARRRPARRRLGWRPVAILLFSAFLAVSFAWAALARAFAPAGNTGASRFDTLIVLGSPADRDGNPRPNMLSRVNEGVREYERGVAPHIILTGGLDGGRFIQAEVMARVAESQGVPASAIALEPEANDTIHNACYSVRIMKAHGWRSAEVIGNPPQLPRAGIIFSRLPIAWRSHGAPFIEPQSTAKAASDSASEILKTVRYLLYARWGESCSP